MNEREHIDIFSGLGGNSVAADIVWPNIKHIFCDYEPFCQAILKKHWPRSPIWGDIRSFTYASSEREREMAEQREQNEKNPDPERPFILTGGFPCQPFSAAGRRKGKDDDRWLWPEMLRVIREARPDWVVGENVAGFVSMVQYESSPPMDEKGVAQGEVGDVYHRVGRGVADEAVEALEAEGYDVQPFVIPACAVNAPHRRDRVWIVAHSESERARRESRAVRGADGGQDDERLSNIEQPNSGDTTDPERKRPQERPPEVPAQFLGSLGNNRERFPAYAAGQRSVERKGQGASGRVGETYPLHRSTDWTENWLEASTRLCGVDDGLPARMDGLELTKAKHRENRLKALGNSIVPQVAIEIFKAIKEVDA